MKAPFIDLAATGRNITNLRIKAGIVVRNLQTVIQWVVSIVAMKKEYGNQE